MNTIRNIFYLIICLAALFAGCAKDPKMPDNDFGAEKPALTIDMNINTAAAEATVYGKIRENGAKVTEKGFCLYKEGEENTPKKFSEVEEGEDGVFYITLTDLERSTDYHLYAYAKNSMGEGRTDTLLLRLPSEDPFAIENVHYPGSSLAAGSAAYVSVLNNANRDERMLGYLIGGSTIDGTLSNEFWKFNPVKQSWESLDPMPEKRSMASSVATTSTIVVFGGIGENDLPANDMYHYLSGNWGITDQINPPSARYASASGLMNVYVYLVGGILMKNNVETITNEVHVFDIWAKSWEARAPFPENQCNGLAFVVGTKLYAGLGYTSLNVVLPTYSKRLYSISGNEGNWTTLPEMPGSKALGGTVVGTNIYVVDDQGYIHIFDTVEDKWKERVENRRLPAEYRKIHCIYGFAGNEKIYIGLGDDSKTVISYDTRLDN